MCVLAYRTGEGALAPDALHRKVAQNDILFLVIDRMGNEFPLIMLRYIKHHFKVEIMTRDLVWVYPTPQGSVLVVSLFLKVYHKCEGR